VASILWSLGLLSIVCSADAVNEGDFDAFEYVPSWRIVSEALTSGESDIEDLHDSIAPLINATKNAYSGDLADPIGQGFALIANHTPADGMNALAYRGSASRVIVAYRGTRSISDECADVLLFTPNDPLPDECEAFSKDTLDYVARAHEFAEEALAAAGDAEDGFDVVFTGHSLGASLAQLMALSFHGTASSNSSNTYRAIAFAPAGIKEIAMRDGFPTKDAKKVAVVLVNKYDPVYTSTLRTEVGSVCEFVGTHKPLLCYCCVSPMATENASVMARRLRPLREGISFSREMSKMSKMSFCCRVCMQKAHRYPNYIRFFEQMTQVPECI